MVKKKVETPIEHVEAHEHRQEVGDERQQQVEDRADRSDIRQDDNDTRQDLSDTRQDVSDTRQDVSDTRQDVSDVRQDDSDTRQDVSEAVSARNAKHIKENQGQQDVTNLITNAHTEQITGMQIEQAAVSQIQSNQSHHLDRITEGVDFLSVQVTTLNERVYTKNYLDRIRNYMIAGAIATFLFVSILLGYTLYSIKAEAGRESNRAGERASEALIARKQIADCTVAPGTILEDGTSNPGICYQTGQDQTGRYLESLVTDISEEVRKLLLSQAEAAAVNLQLSREMRDLAAAQARALRTPPTVVSTSSTTQVATTTTTIRPSVPIPQPEDPGLICNVLSILRLCDA